MVSFFRCDLSSSNKDLMIGVGRVGTMCFKMSRSLKSAVCSVSCSVCLIFSMDVTVRLRRVWCSDIDLIIMRVIYRIYLSDDGNLECF